jgi:hypothetical protein
VQNGLFVSEISTHVITSLLARNTGALLCTLMLNGRSSIKTQFNSVFVWIMQNRCQYGTHVIFCDAQRDELLQNITTFRIKCRYPPTEQAAAQLSNTHY